MLELAEVIWRKIKGPDVPLRSCTTTPFEHDVQKPRARDREGQARCSASRPPRPWSDMLDEVIPWIDQAIADGTI